MGLWRRALPVIGALGALGITAPSALAAIGTPGVTLAPSSATAASTANLGTDITFSPSGGDSVKNLTLELPAGLIANASIDGGACLTAAAPVGACQVGTGTVTAAENSLLGASLSLPAEFFLVAPPAAGDLAGLAVSVQDPQSGAFNQLGTPAAVTVRPASDPAGVGLDIAFSDIPDTYSVLGVSTSISVTAIDSTFDGLRFPSTCPATPADVTVSATSYGDPTVRSGTAPLTVTGCGSVPDAPQFALSAVRDRSDPQVTLTTVITQAAGQATNRSVTLAFPTAVLLPNVGVVGALCAAPASGSCRTIGAATALSPEYPTPLTGQAYLTGSVLAPGITLVFPAPFSLSLSGQVNLGTNSTTFTGLPDIPLSRLQVTLDGGADGAFQSTCDTTSGSARATFVSQNGDRTVTASAPFTVGDCTKTTPASHPPRVTSPSISGLTTGKPTLAFTLAAATGAGAAKLGSLTVELPAGLSIVRRREGKRLTVSGVTSKGAKIKSLTVSHGHLVIALRTGVTKLSVKLGARALRETAALKAKARHRRITSLKLTVLAATVKHTSKTIRVVVKNLHL